MNAKRNKEIISLEPKNYVSCQLVITFKLRFTLRSSGL